MRGRPISLCRSEPREACLMCWLTLVGGEDCLPAVLSTHTAIRRPSVFTLQSNLLPKRAFMCCRLPKGLCPEVLEVITLCLRVQYSMHACVTDSARGGAQHHITHAYQVMLVPCRVGGAGFFHSCRPRGAWQIMNPSVDSRSLPQVDPLKRPTAEELLRMPQFRSGARATTSVPLLPVAPAAAVPALFEAGRATAAAAVVAATSAPQPGTTLHAASNSSYPAVVAASTVDSTPRLPPLPTKQGQAAAPMGLSPLLPSRAAPAVERGMQSASHESGSSFSRDGNPQTAPGPGLDHLSRMQVPPSREATDPPAPAAGEAASAGQHLPPPGPHVSSEGTMQDSPAWTPPGAPIPPVAQRGGRAVAVGDVGGARGQQPPGKPSTAVVAAGSSGGSGSCPRAAAAAAFAFSNTPAMQTPAAADQPQRLGALKLGALAAQGLDWTRNSLSGLSSEQQQRQWQQRISRQSISGMTHQLTDSEREAIAMQVGAGGGGGGGGGGDSSSNGCSLGGALVAEFGGASFGTTQTEKPQLNAPDSPPGYRRSMSNCGGGTGVSAAPERERNLRPTSLSGAPSGSEPAPFPSPGGRAGGLRLGQPISRLSCSGLGDRGRNGGDAAPQSVDDHDSTSGPLPWQRSNSNVGGLPAAGRRLLGHSLSGLPHQGPRQQVAEGSCDDVAGGRPGMMMRVSMPGHLAQLRG